MRFTENQDAVEELSAQGADGALADCVHRGAWTAVRTILVSAPWKMASKEAVKFDPRLRIKNLMSSNRPPRLKACKVPNRGIGS
jgi:hypothetical protein